MTDHILTDHASSAGCEAFEASLADYLDGTLDPAALAAADAHLAGCSRCAALVADLEEITARARALPPVTPSPERASAMWRGIAERIEAPVVSVEPKRADAAARSRGVRLVGWRRTGLAAAALVLFTAGVTYEVTKRFERGDEAPATVADAPRTPTAPTASSASAATTPAIATAPADQRVASNDARESEGDEGEPSRGSSAASPRAERRTVANRSASPAEATYEREIEGLRRIVRERRDDLDSSTVAVLDRNLKVIDDAIAQSRAALARDPRSRFLNQQLNSALDKKVELLRTAALLPSRT